MSEFKSSNNPANVTVIKFILTVNIDLIWKKKRDKF